MIQAVIFDWGGVLIDSPTPGIVTYWANFFQVAEEEFNRVSQKYIQNFQKGEISEDKFWDRVCSDLDIPKPHVHSLWENAFSAVYHEQKKVFDLAFSLKKNGYKIGFLSNTETPAMNFFYNQHYSMFDALVFSCTEGVRKPERRIYKITLRRLDVKAPEAILVDDRRENIFGAKTIGMNAILFKDYNQLEKTLTVLSVKVD